MNLQVSSYKGRKYLSIVRTYRDPETKKVKHKSIKSLGYLDELEKHWSNPVEHFRQVAAEMSRQEAEASPPVVLELKRARRMNTELDNPKSLGWGERSLWQTKA